MSRCCGWVRRNDPWPGRLAGLKLHFGDIARFQWRPDRTGWADHLLTAFLRMFLGGRFADYRRRFRDVHERNVVFEIRGWRQRGVPVPACDAAGRIRLVRVRLRPIDVR